MRLHFWDTYRHVMIAFAVLVFFTNFSDYTQKFGLIPLMWIALFAALCAPLLIHGIYDGHVPLRPLVIWTVFYLFISLGWFYRSGQGQFAYEEVQKRVLAMMFLLLSMIVCSRPEEQTLARKWIAAAVVLASMLNVYELFNPLTFSDIPGRSSGLYTNVNQSGAALVLGLILSYHVIPDRFKLAFVALTAIGIIPTFSRSAMIGWLIVVGYFFLRAGFRAQLRRLTVLSVVVIGLVFSPLWGNVQQTLEDRGVLNLNIIERIAFFTGGRTDDASSNERRMVAAKAWEMYGERPVDGWGTGASRQMEGFEVGTHNIYLAMLVDHGVIGFLIVPLLLLAVVWGANRTSIDLAIPWLLFMLIWGLFSHNVLEERYILLAAALTAGLITSRRSNAVPVTTSAPVRWLPPGSIVPLP